MESTRTAMSKWNFLFLALLFLSGNAVGAIYLPPDSLDLWVEQSRIEWEHVSRDYKTGKEGLWAEIHALDIRFSDVAPNRYRKWNQYWQKRNQLEKQMEELEAERELQLLEFRYKKGIDLIKLLYEKILALDHHFSGMQIYQHIMVLSNPNTYPDFQKTQRLLEEKLKKKNMLQLPPLLHTNPYLSAAFSLVATVVGEGEPKEKQKEFESISCILDFTVRMGSELSVIQHETEYLKAANQALKEECERLFEDYVKVVGYLVPLNKCRLSDDWEKVYLHLDEFVHSLEEDPGLESGMRQGPKNRWTRERVNLEFATQRVADFIGKYQSFVTQGTQYYQKFDNIVSTYENEDLCKQALPYQFEELREDIRQTIDKFSNTYNLPEIQGSRMKDLLFGTVE